eukprot:761378-Pelagomonas_calceolata.AAC.1
MDIFCVAGTDQQSELPNYLAEVQSPWETCNLVFIGRAHRSGYCVYRHGLQKWRSLEQAPTTTTNSRL